MVTTPSNLRDATEAEKTAAGVDPAQKVQVYTKTAGVSADLDNPGSMYFSNENGYDYISFDFYFASMPAGQENGLPYVAMKAYNNLVAANATANTQSADGLGLTIVKHAVQYHQGKIEMESEPGKGTTISIQFKNI